MSHNDDSSFLFHPVSVGISRKFLFITNQKCLHKLKFLKNYLKVFAFAFFHTVYSQLLTLLSPLITTIHHSILPNSLEQLSIRYESAVKSMQDSILIVDSLMGNEGVIAFNMPNSFRRLDVVNTAKEERRIIKMQQVVEEYKKIIDGEKKKRDTKEKKDLKI